MKIGLFDHVEHGGRPLAALFDERLTFAAAADEAGIYGLHIAEHHGTPLNMAPVPGVYLAAVARATKRMRLGPLVYLLPLYSPLRLVEEICMLDHLSHGRLDVGVGRGVSPWELKFHHVAHDDARDIFLDAFKCISAGLTADALTYQGKHFAYDDVPMALRPLQQPHPPFWYASSSAVGATWAGEQGLHFVTLGPTASAKANIDAYRTALKRRGAPAQPKPEFPGGAVIGVSRYIFVADSDARGAADRTAGGGSARRACKVARHRARRHRVDRTAQCRLRRLFRRFARRRNGDRRHADECARADRTAGRRAGHQLSAQLPLPRQYDARRRAALARLVQERGDAASGEAVTHHFTASSAGRA